MPKQRVLVRKELTRGGTTGLWWPPLSQAQSMSSWQQGSCPSRLSAWGLVFPEMARWTLQLWSLPGLGLQPPLAAWLQVGSPNPCPRDPAPPAAGQPPPPQAGKGGRERGHPVPRGAALSSSNSGHIAPHLPAAAALFPDPVRGESLAY